MQLGLMDVFTWHVRDLQGVQMVNAVWTLTEIYTTWLPATLRCLNTPSVPTQGR